MKNDENLLITDRCFGNCDRCSDSILDVHEHVLMNIKHQYLAEFSVHDTTSCTSLSGLFFLMNSAYELQVSSTFLFVKLSFFNTMYPVILFAETQL